MTLYSKLSDIKYTQSRKITPEYNYNFVVSHFDLHHNNTSRPSNATIFVKTKKLIKLYILTPTTWSSGMIASLLFITNVVDSKKYLNIKNARKEWGVWAYAHEVWWVNQILDWQHFNSWSIRIRRLFRLTSDTNTTIQWNSADVVTPKRRIKRWLKKKYTSQSWR